MAASAFVPTAVRARTHLEDAPAEVATAVATIAPMGVIG
jgi:hypothetical protein